MKALIFGAYGSQVGVSKPGRRSSIGGRYGLPLRMMSLLRPAVPSQFSCDFLELMRHGANFETDKSRQSLTAFRVRYKSKAPEVERLLLAEKRRS